MNIKNIFKICQYSILVLILSISSVQNASPNEPYSQPLLSHSELELLTSKLCLIIHNGRNREDYNIPEKLKSILMRSANIQGSDKDDIHKLARWINLHSSGFVCEKSSGLYPRQHLFQRAVELNVEQGLFQGFLTRDPENFPIDFNVSQPNDKGDFSTIIDFLEEMMAKDDFADDYNVGEIDRLYRILKLRFEARRFNELTASQKAKYVSLYNGLDFYAK